MGEENKEFVAGLSAPEKEATESRHRSVSQLERHGAEVTEEGRLEVTPKQIESVRKTMDKELSERPLSEKIIAGAVRMSRRIEESMGKATERVTPLLERGKELWGRAATKAGVLVREIDPREFVASLVDLPARFTEWSAERAIRRVEDLKKERDADFNVLKTENKRLGDEASDRMGEMREALLGRKDALNVEFRNRRGFIEEKYGVLPAAVAESKNQALETLKLEEQARVAELKGEHAAFVAQEKQRLEEDRRELQETFEKYVPPLFEWIGDAIEQRETWALRASRAREASQRIRGFLGVRV
jgi:hypothetical protein